MGGSPSTIENYQVIDHTETTSTKNHIHTYTFHHLYFAKNMQVMLKCPALHLNTSYFFVAWKFVFQQNKTVDFCLGPAWVTEKDLREKKKQFFPSSGSIAYIYSRWAPKKQSYIGWNHPYTYMALKTWVTGVKKTPCMLYTCTHRTHGTGIFTDMKGENGPHSRGILWGIYIWAICISSNYLLLRTGLNRLKLLYWRTSLN